jgi:phenylalanyl-tRNA synthetase beta chain
MKRIKPPFTYKAVEPSSIRFVPLGNNEEMDLHEILQKHEKGIAFASILDGCKRYPIIIDANNQILSFPPIINGTITRVTSETKDIFIDVTGTDFNAVNSTLNIIVTAMADRGGKIQSVKIHDGKKTIKTPNLPPTTMKLKCGDVNDAIGLNISKKDIKTSLHRMGYGVEESNKAEGAKNDCLKVLIPAYRCDILHNIDLIEDVAIGYGYGNLKGQLPKSSTFGSRRGIEDFSDKLRLIMIGLGFQEVTTLTLSNEKDNLEFTPENDSVVRIKNPITEEHTVVRTVLIPSLLNILKINKRHNLPQKIVEIGDVVIDNANVRKIASLNISSKAGFSDVKSTVECLLKNLNIDYNMEIKQHPAFINGRCASIYSKGNELGYFGEIHPKTIIDFELEHPINGFEIDVNRLMEACGCVKAGETSHTVKNKAL